MTPTQIRKDIQEYLERIDKKYWKKNEEDLASILAVIKTIEGLVK